MERPVPRHGAERLAETKPSYNIPIHGPELRGEQAAHLLAGWRHDSIRQGGGRLTAASPPPHPPPSLSVGPRHPPPRVPTRRHPSANLPRPPLAVPPPIRSLLFLLLIILREDNHSLCTSHTLHAAGGELWFFPCGARGHSYMEIGACRPAMT